MTNSRKRTAKTKAAGSRRKGKSKQTGQSSLKRRIYVTLLELMLFLILLGGLFFGAVYIGVFGPLPTRAELEAIRNEEASLILASDGTLIGKIFAENRTNIHWDEVPSHLVEALVSTEDKRYFSHQGIDGRSTMRVLIKTLLLGDRSSGGGSTLSQQLIKNLYGRSSHNFLSMPVNKLREAIIAVRLESVYSKEDILLLYLNSVPFGEDVYGIEAAASRYFGKHARDLNVQESAVLVGMLKANTTYNPRLHPDNATGRRNQILSLMAQEGYLSEAEADRLKKTPLGLKYHNLQTAAPSGYFVYQVKRQVREILDQLAAEGVVTDAEKDGLRVYTTLDMDLQLMAEDAVQRQLVRMQPLLDHQLGAKGREAWLRSQPESIRQRAQEPKKLMEVVGPAGMVTMEMNSVDSLWYYTRMLQPAVLITNPKTAEVLTWIGGSNFRYLPYDQVLARRQAASTFKPLVYTAALEQGATPCTYLGNKEKTYDNYEGWAPQNYDHSQTEDQKVALWYALAHSMNLPTIDLYFRTGHVALLNLCNRLDIAIPDYETPSLALGTAEVSLRQMVGIYSTFADGGRYRDELVMVRKITDARGNTLWQADIPEGLPVIRSGVTDTLTVMLENAVNTGTGTRLRNTYHLKADLAGKTGTSQDYTDAWFMGYTPDLVVGVRMGASDPSVHFVTGLGSGSSLALPVAGMTLEALERQKNMATRYLTPFMHDQDSLLACDAFREKGLEGVINRLLGKEVRTGDEGTLPEAPPQEKKERSRVGRFFDRLFKGRKK